MKQKTLPVQSRLDENHYELLTAIAQKKGVSVSLMVRMILIEKLEAK
jgi:hypothetical protein